jgi:hypothetical protein
LWTTIGDGVRPYDFDSFRVFIWSLRRHRYETAFIERNIQGYAPVLVKPVELSGAKGKGATKYPGFSVCLEKKDGPRLRREYAFLENVVRFADEKPCEAAAPDGTVTAKAALPEVPEDGAAKPAPTKLTARIRDRLRRWFGR